MTHGNLPPGVTDGDIDRAAPGYYDDPSKHDWVEVEKSDPGDGDEAICRHCGVSCQSEESDIPCDEIIAKSKAGLSGSPNGDKAERREEVAVPVEGSRGARSIGPCECGHEYAAHDVDYVDAIQGPAGGGACEKCKCRKFREQFEDAPARTSPPRYQVQAFDRGALLASWTGATFNEALIVARGYAKKYPGRAIRLMDQVHADIDHDGLSDPEREQFEEAIAPPSTARRLRDFPALKLIDDYAQAIQSLRPGLTNPDREAWSAVNDIQRQAKGLVEACYAFARKDSGAKGVRK